ncbi:hypothetical protein BLNAU_15731 [Blattamonas nauphoetae]|uniref:Right handed beta helix domain-containing protein n=1 Tax=Blattamonas nauphoetae TaxID=2049346 RepID=A0ABQ9XBQ3_9EUKA|nr:hypothetical protein BLNAU_15731 [Blattamonas nauphoetae]
MGTGLVKRDSTIVEVIVSEGGSNRTEECGSFSTPCSSIAIGWKTGTEEEGLNEVILLIHKSARFGSQVHVGRKTLEMRGLFEGESRVDVEEEAGREGKEEGVVVVAGGSLQMTGLTLRLPRPSLVGETKTASVVVSGFGECVLDGVRVVESWEGEGVGMGMVLWSGGSLRLTKIEMKSIWMESNVTLVKCSSSSTEVTLEMSDCMFVEVETRNAELVAFSSTLASSRFEMDGCVFLSTNRSETRGGERTGLIKISTGQERTEIRKCKFSDCGTLLTESGGRKRGGVLIVEIRRESILDRKEVRIVDCIVMNSSPLRESEGEEMSGGVVVWSSGKGVVVVDVGGSWFEETAFSKQELERDSLGMPIVSPKRKIVHSLSSDVPAGLVVGGGGSDAHFAWREGRQKQQLGRTTTNSDQHSATDDSSFPPTPPRYTRHRTKHSPSFDFILRMDQIAHNHFEQPVNGNICLALSATGDSSFPATPFPHFIPPNNPESTQFCPFLCRHSLRMDQIAHNLFSHQSMESPVSLSLNAS